MAGRQVPLSPCSASVSSTRGRTSSTTKRGPRRLRQYLYLAVLRWIQDDAVARAWCEQRSSATEGEITAKALVTLMRKLLSGLW